MPPLPNSASPDPLSAPRFLVCAGSTRERLDQVRDWGNIFTGGTGFDIARALAQFGPVDLLTSNRDHLALVALGDLTPFPIRGFAFRSHADLRQALAERMAGPDYAAISMSAAVSDYTPDGSFAVLAREAAADGTEHWQVRDVQAGKVSSQHARLAVLGRQTEKLVDLFRGTWGFRGLLVKFKLEVGLDHDRLIAVGEASRQASGADLLVANTLDMVAGDRPGAWLLGDGAPCFISRPALAGELAAVVMRRVRPAHQAQPAVAGAPPLAALLATQCRQLATLLGGLNPAVFSARDHGATIGEHVRHGLDHLRAVHRGATSGVVDYEQRRRGWAGERDAAQAMAELAHLATAFDALRAADLLRPVVVRCLVDPGQPAIALASTLARELLFAQSHETHHAAIIARILDGAGLAPPPGFGIAPSTQAFRGDGCAVSA